MPIERYGDVKRMIKFLDKIQFGEGCWEWTAAKRTGYGNWWDGTRWQQAHRVSYEWATGAAIPEGMVIDHLCRNRACVRPDHMEVVTNQINVKRGERGVLRPRDSLCANGHEYTDETTHINSKGHRSCRTCTRAHWRKYNAKRPKMKGRNNNGKSIDGRGWNLR